MEGLAIHLPFEAIEYGEGDITLYYTNGSGPEPQTNSMLLSLEEWEANILGGSK
tara:strand:- start:98 stop:259 length:162 start_codon:yes stop_codon:yes gene_type:complete